MSLPALRISSGIDRLIREEGVKSYPYECCGVMAGTLAGGVRTVTGIYPQRNERDDSPQNRFLISPDHIVQSELRAAKEGLDVLGFYHSHPDCPAIPSQFDQDHAWPWYSYVIVSVREGKPAELLSWQLTDDRSRMLAEPVEVFPDV